MSEGQNRPRPHDLNQLSAFAEQRLDEAGRGAVVEHVAECRECREVLALVAQARFVAAAPPRPSPNRPSALRRWAPLAAAATLVLAAGAYVVDRPGRTTAPVRAPVAAAAAATREGTIRTLAGRQFRFVDGGWVDRTYDPAAALPVVDVRTAAGRAGAIAARPDLEPFLQLAPRFTVVLGGTVYRFELPASS